jgi:hypothetical protein
MFHPRGLRIAAKARIATSAEVGLRTGMYGAWIIASMFFSFPPAKGWYLTGNEKVEGKVEQEQGV